MSKNNITIAPLTESKIKLEDKENLSLKDALALIKELFNQNRLTTPNGGQKNGAVLVETAAKYQTGFVEEIDTFNYDNLLSLTVFDDDKTLQLDGVDDNYSARIIGKADAMNMGTEYTVYPRVNNYVLRKDNKAQCFRDVGAQSFIHTEYFKIEEKSNMPLPFVNRLSGLSGI